MLIDAKAGAVLHLPAPQHECVGCGLCVSVCPRGALRMAENAEGFMAPRYDAAACINCHACEKACERMHAYRTPQHAVQVFGGYAADGEVRRKSTSGGLAWVLGRHIIRRGGIVFGVEMDDTLNARFIAVETEQELSRIRGTKYIQADPADCFKHLAQEVKSGRPVLFFGLHCQVRALRSRFGSKYSNLLAVDLACYGTPSRLLFRAWLKHEAADKPVQHVGFREKREGWRKSGSAVIAFSDGTARTIDAQNNLFHRFFLSSLCLNRSCYDCKIALNERCSDITLGDFWGNRHFSQQEERDGLSVVCCHTAAGAALIQEIGAAVCSAPVSVTEGCSANHGLSPAHRMMPPLRQKFISALTKKPLTALEREFLEPDGRARRAFKWGHCVVRLPRSIVFLGKLLRKVKGKLGAFRRKNR